MTDQHNTYKKGARNSSRKRSTPEADSHPKGVIRLSQLYHEELSDQDIEDGVHKHIIGSPVTSWEGAGRFQLHFLREMGLEQNSALLDVGCGPGRGSEHFIPYLDRGMYNGMDHNPSYIRACELMIEQNGLRDKNPRFTVSRDFQLEAPSRFDFVMAFSVVQYLDSFLRRTFFKRIPARLSQGGKLYITHANWLDEGDLASHHCRVSQTIESDAFDLSKFGWVTRESGDGVFPIVEIMQN